MTVPISIRLSGAGPNPNAPRTVKERLDALRLVPRLLRLVWETHRPYAAAMILLRVVHSAVPVVSLWLGKLIIDDVVTLAKSGGSARDLWVVVALEMATVVLSDVLTRASSLVEALLGDLFTNSIMIRIMEHAARLDLRQFEDPKFYDHLERARQGTQGRLTLVTQLLGAAQSALTLGTLTVGLATQAPWLLLLLVAAVLPSFIGETHFAGLSYALLFRWTPQRRLLDYIGLIGASNETAKEVQLFGLGPWLTARFRTLSTRFYKENRALTIRRVLAGSALSLLGSGGYYAAYVVILLRAISGTISVGTLAFLAASFRQSRDIIQNLLMSASGIYQQSLSLRDLFAFFDMQATIASRPNARPIPRPIRHGFEFEDVGFRYPGSERWAVRHLTLALRVGERIALVGENGAGKTTLTKLIARLYDPSEGRILLDGVDLRDYDLAELRHAIGVIFQDFVRYDMRFDENIGVGEIDVVSEYLDSEVARGTEPPDAILTASNKSLAASLLSRLPAGYGQMLGRRFQDGVDLSGGEWQKVALARAYMRDAQLVILDEPTAALDARAEYEVFLRFNEIMDGRMAIVISHRFSTVRMADRILVLRQGKIAEAGTHDDLVAAGDLYAELFGMQAAGYR